MPSYSMECAGVSKDYGHVKALNSITLNIEEGEIVAVLGPNGAGKSTLLKIFATQIAQSSGSLKILGRDPGKEREKVRQMIGFLAHGSFMYDELTIEENLNFYAKMFSLEPSRLEEVVFEVMKLMRLEQLASVPVKRLSHGLRKRSDLARTFLHSPSLVVLDEPFSGLDEATVKLLLDHLKMRGKRTLILSSHSPELAKEVCSRVISLDRGQLVSDSKW